MNKLLAGSLSILNAFLVVAFIGAGAFAGYLRFGEDPLSISLGGGVGLIVAIVFCGLLAVFLDMRRELIEFRKAAATAQSTQASAMAEISMRLGEIHRDLGAIAAAPPVRFVATAPPPVGQADTLETYQLDNSDPLPTGKNADKTVASSPNQVMGVPRQVTIRRHRRRSRTEFRVSVGEPGQSEEFAFELADKAVIGLMSSLQKMGPYTGDTSDPTSPSDPVASSERFPT